MRFILHIESDNMSRLSFKMDVTYSHLSKTAKEMEAKGWLTRIKRGRVNQFALTQKGIEMRQACQIIAQEIGNAYLK